MNLTEEVSRGYWMVGELGASVLGNPAVADMVKHHAVLYRDLADPLAILRPRQYRPAGLLELCARGNNPDEGHREYSQLMSSSLALISDHILETTRSAITAALWTLAGGTGHFARW